MGKQFVAVDFKNGFIAQRSEVSALKTICVCRKQWKSVAAFFQLFSSSNWIFRFLVKRFDYRSEESISLLDLYVCPSLLSFGAQNPRKSLWKWLSEAHMLVILLSLCFGLVRVVWHFGENRWHFIFACDFHHKPSLWRTLHTSKVQPLHSSRFSNKITSRESCFDVCYWSQDCPHLSVTTLWFVQRVWPLGYWETIASWRGGLCLS